MTDYFQWWLLCWSSEPGSVASQPQPYSGDKGIHHSKSRSADSQPEVGKIDLSEFGSANFKETVSRDFLLLVFFMNQFPPHPRVFHLDRFEFFRKFAEIFASQGAPYRWQICHRCQRYRRQICHRCQRRRWQRHRRQICHRCRWHRWQIMATISGCKHLKVNLKAKFINMFTLLPKGVQTKLLKFFCLKVFPFATGVVDTGGKPWAANISANFRNNSKRP